jgi:PAS domain S-box-containing protein
MGRTTDNKRVEMSSEQPLQMDPRAFEDFFNASPIGLVIAAPTGQIVRVNQAMCESLGYKEKELLQLAFIDITHPDDLAENKVYLKKMLNGDLSSYKLQKRYVRKDGSVMHGIVMVTGQRDDKGRIERLMGQIVDVTEMQQAEETLRVNTDQLAAQQQFLRQIIDTDPNMIFVKDYEGKFVLANEAVAAVYDTTPDELVGLTDADFNPNQAEVEHYLKHDRQVMDSGKPEFISEEPVTNQDTGETRWYKTIKVPLDKHANGNKMVLGVASDVTDIKRAEQVRAACYNIASASSTETDLDILFQKIHIELNDIMSSKNFYIAFYDKQQDTISFPYYMDEHFLADGYAPPPRKAGKGLTEYVIRTGKPIILDEKKIKELSKAKKVKIQGPRPKVWMGTPLKAGKKITGVISVQSYESPIEFADSDLDLLGMVASQVQNLIKRQAAIDAAREQEAHLLMMTDQMSSVLWSFDLDLIFTASKGAGLKALGLKPNQAVGLHLFDYMQNSDPEYLPIRAHLDALSGKTSSYELEFAGLTFQSVVQPMFDAVGNVIGGIGFAVDITERRKSEQELRKQEAIRTSEKKFRQYLENISMIGVSIGKDRKIEYVNDFTLKLTGWKQNDVIGKDWFTLFVPQQELKDRIKRFKKYIKEGKTESKSYEGSIVCKTGEVRNVKWSTSLIFDEAGDPIGLTGIGEDITNLKLTEEALKLSDNILNRISNLVLVADRNAKIIYISPSVKELLGYDQSELLGDKWWQIATGNDIKSSDAKAQLLKFAKSRGGISTPYERQAKRKDGEWRWIQWHNSKSKEGLIIGVGHDITEEKQAEQELVEAKKNAEESARVKTAFLANMSHELRTPMNGILGMVDLMMDTPLSGEQQDYASTIKGSASHLLNLLNNVLDYSTMETGRMQIRKERTDLSLMFTDLVNSFSSRNENPKVSIKKVIGPRIPAKISVDNVRLQQVLTNLVENALKFTKKGSVTLGCKVVKRTNAKVIVEFYVSDTGIGIAQKNQKFLFDKFVQLDSSLSREHKGTGLGLAICKELVRLMGGEIQLKSTSGKGSKFSFRLETTYTDSKKRSTLPTKAGTKLLAGHVLLIEDDPVNLKVTTKMLEKAGITVDTAVNGISGKRLLKKQSHDLVLLDLHMPGMTGEAFLKDMPQGNRPPIIVLTANTLSEKKAAIMDLGANEYLTKPIDFETLYLHLAKYLKASKSKANGKSTQMHHASIKRLQDLFGDDFDDLVGEYLSETEKQLNSALRSIKKKDLRTAARSLHTIKGTSATMGISQIARQAEIAESAIREHDLDSGINLLHELESLFSQLKEQI